MSFETDVALEQVSQCVRDIENKNGRSRSGPKFGPRTLDIDLLLFGDMVGCWEGVVLPRDEILKNAFVLLPLSEIAGHERHPEVNSRYADLWLAYDKSKQKLWRVAFCWRESPL